MSKKRPTHSFRFKTKIKIFWKSHTKYGQPSFIIDRALISDYLEWKGYKRLSCFEDFQIFQLIDNIAYLKTPQIVYNDLLDFIKEQENDTLRSCFIEQGENLLLSKKAILGSLPVLEKERYQDSKETVRLFFLDTIVVIRADKIKTLSFKKFRKLDKFIFSERIIPRNFIKINKKESDFKQFLRLATNDNYHFESVCTSMGYLISSYKNPSIAKAAIITDILSQVRNEAFGRSGKGLFIKALSKVINVVEYNGKVTDLSNDKFVFQNVNITTSLIVLQDVTRDFLFESLFSTLTDSMSIERKHRSKISISFSESPKVAITTNYTIPQDTDSFNDRKHLVTLNNFFNAKNKPEKHFKSLLFDWAEHEWLSFDNFIIECVQLFLKKGLIKYDSSDLKLQKLINITSKKFVEVMNSSYDELNNYWSIKKIATNIEVGTNKPSVKSRIVSKWIESYATFKGYKIDRRLSGGIVKICFKN